MKESILKKYRSFIEKTGKEPFAACCEIRYKDGLHHDFPDIVCLTGGEDAELDNRIFFYCDGVDELVKLNDDDNGEDFTIPFVYDFHTREEIKNYSYHY